MFMTVICTLYTDNLELNEYKMFDTISAVSVTMLFSTATPSLRSVAVECGGRKLLSIVVTVSSLKDQTPI